MKERINIQSKREKMVRQPKKRDNKSFKKELSNNILILILLVIIFVSLLSTFIIKQAIEEAKTMRQTIVVQEQQPSTGSGIVGLTVLPQKESKKGGHQ